jgi:hypothetical protein
MRMTLPTMHGLAWLAALSFGLAGCGGIERNAASVAAAGDARMKAAWVELGASGRDALVRAVTSDAVCPAIAIDGRSAAMTLRAAAGTVAQRPTASDAADSKPSAFPVNTCETTLPAGAKQVVVAGRPLPLPRAEPQRIVVLADTGCRMKKADNAFQACSDANAWPFAVIAATAAAMKPDLVIHIGDYHYRENACPKDIKGCADSPWGYGWDTWEADFFQPAAPLLAAAPWIVVRGNHEECARAGQGWYRFLDVRSYDAARSCDLPANDPLANFSEPYAVPLGRDTQLIVFDSSASGTKPIATGDARFAAYRSQFQAVAVLAATPGVTTLFADHHPILALVPASGGKPFSAGAALQSVMTTLWPRAYYPDGVKVALHGHVHDFQAISFGSDHPATFVSGNGGDNLDVNLPDPLPADVSAAPGTLIERISHTNTFGFMLMERDGARWLYKAYTRSGKLLTTCTPAGSKMLCDKLGFLAP